MSPSAKTLDVVIEFAKYNPAVPGSAHVGCRAAAASSLSVMLERAVAHEPVCFRTIVMPKVAEASDAIVSLVLDATPELRQVGFECLVAVRALDPSSAQTAEERVHEGAPDRIKHLEASRA